MGMRIRMVLGCLAACGAAVIMTGMAAQAAPLAVTHGHPAPAISSGGNSGWSGGSSGSGNSGWGQSSSSPCTSTPTPTPPAPQTATPTPTMVTTTPPPSGAPQTGGGGSISGGDGPLAAGGVATALVGGVIGLFAFRRWRRTRLPAA
jgi:hypothetical protein